MKLGQLIDRLAELPNDLEVVRSDGKTPLALSSWRGVYAELTLTSAYEEEPYRSKQLNSVAPKGRITVGFLLGLAKKADGGTFTGYKGGDFKMDRDTTVWADEYGDCDYWCIAGINERDGKVVIDVVNRDDELEKLGLSDYVKW